MGIGAVLIQEKHPLAYFSKKLGPRRRSASTYHKELYAIVEAVQKWQQYLLGREFIIRTDQKSLRDLLQQVVQTPDQHFYVRKLMGFKFRIEYKRGSTNKVADALSRRDDTVLLITDSASLNPLISEAAANDDTAFLLAVSVPVPHILAELKQETSTLPDLLSLSQKISEVSAPSHLSLVDGLIYYDCHILLSPNSALRSSLLEEYHCTPMAGHPGYERTFRLLSAVFYWSNRRKDAKKFC